LKCLRSLTTWLYPHGCAGRNRDFALRKRQASWSSSPHQTFTLVITTPLQNSRKVSFAQLPHARVEESPHRHWSQEGRHTYTHKIHEAKPRGTERIWPILSHYLSTEWTYIFSYKQHRYSQTKASLLEASLLEAPPLQADTLHTDNIHHHYIDMHHCSLLLQWSTNLLGTQEYFWKRIVKGNTSGKHRTCFQPLNHLHSTSTTQRITFKSYINHWKVSQYGTNVILYKYVSNVTLHDLYRNLVQIIYLSHVRLLI